MSPWQQTKAEVRRPYIKLSDVMGGNIQITL